jgi:hypothetical protein
MVNKLGKILVLEEKTKKECSLLHKNMILGAKHFQCVVNLTPEITYFYTTLCGCTPIS